MEMFVSPTDSAIICDIAKRFRDLCAAHNSQHRPDVLAVVMDLTATHANGNPLQLSALLTAKDSDFAHDVAGIRHNLNRETGKLENGFSPRYSARNMPGNSNGR